MRLFHGGATGRAPGDWLLPRRETGWPSTSERLAAAGIAVAGMEDDRDRADMVYLTTERQLAAAYATQWATVSGHRYGTLYVADPSGGVAPDPDLPGVSVQCPRARVIQIADPCVLMPVAKMLRILGRHVTGPPAVFSDRRSGRIVLL